MKQIYLHHTDDPSGAPQFQKVNQFHKSKGFRKSLLGFWVGYHYFIGKDGTVRQARAEEEEGNHTVSDKYPKANREGIGICLAGDFTKQDPTDRQLESLAALMNDLMLRHGIPEREVILHREAKPTQCPGKDLRELTRNLRVSLLKFQVSQMEGMMLRSSVERSNRLSLRVNQMKQLLSSF